MAADVTVLEKNGGVWHRAAPRYGSALAAVGVATLLRLAAAPSLIQDNPYLLYFAAVMVSAWFGGAGPGLLATVAAAVVCDFFFLEPFWSFGGYTHGQVISFVKFAAEGGVISLLCGAMHTARGRAEDAATAERRARAEAEAARADLARSYEKQRRIAEALQRSLLQQIPDDRFDGLDVAAIYEAALDEARVGGDFYDAFPLPDGRVALVVGDVSGKGLAAAERTAEARYALRLLLSESGGAPDRALAALNHYLCGATCEAPHSLPSGGVAGEPAFRFIVAAAAVLDPNSGDGVLALAGSEPPLLALAAAPDRSERSEVTLLDVAVHGMPLGIDAGATYEPIRFGLAPGDALLLFTDGLTEARRPGTRGAFLEPEGLREAVEGVVRSQSAGASAAATGRRVVEQVRAFAGGTLGDDACLLIVRRR